MIDIQDNNSNADNDKQKDKDGEKMDSSVKKPSIDGKLKQSSDKSSSTPLIQVKYPSGITSPTQQILPKRYERPLKPSKLLVEGTERRLHEMVSGAIKDNYEVIEEIIEVPLEEGE